MAITQREAFAQVMEHLCTHNGGAGHGYSQYNRMGDGTTETIRLSDGTAVTIAGGDRDCSSAVITALRAVGVNTFGATYTGNMKAELLKTGLFVWQAMGKASAKRGDIYLNEVHHTAVCISGYGSARGDLLAQFSISEKGTVTGTKGDQNGRESNIRAYYSYPWNGKLVWKSDGKVLNGSNTEVKDNTHPDLGDTRYWGPKFNRALQKQLGTTVDVSCRASGCRTSPTSGQPTAVSSGRRPARASAPIWFWRSKRRSAARSTRSPAECRRAR